MFITLSITINATTSITFLYLNLDEHTACYVAGLVTMIVAILVVNFSMLLLVFENGNKYNNHGSWNSDCRPQKEILALHSSRLSRTDILAYPDPTTRSALQRSFL
eukprot:SM000073S21438  [mRNA]  locus=s73:238704:239872:- [translate_table: standard]